MSSPRRSRVDVRAERRVHAADRAGRWDPTGIDAAEPGWRRDRSGPRFVRVAGALFAAALLAGCPAAKTVEAQPAAPTSAPASQPASPHAELTQMDGRIVVPMPPRMANHHRQQMRSHLEVVQQIVAALATDDFAQVRKAAEPIAASASNDHQCEMMGRGAEGFTEQALRFHETANGILEAADKRDRAGVLTALSETVAVCTGCHAAFQQEIVTWDDWKARTAK